MKLQQKAGIVFATLSPPHQLSAAKGIPTTTTCQKGTVETCWVSHVERHLQSEGRRRRGQRLRRQRRSWREPGRWATRQDAAGRLTARGVEGWAPLLPAEEPLRLPEMHSFCSTMTRRPCQNDGGENGTCESRLSSPVCAAKKGECWRTPLLAQPTTSATSVLDPGREGVGPFHHEKGATCKFGHF